MKILQTIIGLGLLFFLNIHAFAQIATQDVESMVGKTVQKFNDQSFLDDLEVVEEQRNEIQTIYREMLKRRGTAMREQTFSKELDKRLMKEALVEIWNDVLLPAQKQRFAQLVNQADLNQNSSGSLSDYLLKNRDALQLTDAQFKSLGNVAKEHEKALLEEVKRFSKRVDKLLKAEQNKTKAVLNPIQLKRLTEYLGDPKFGKRIGEAAMKVMGRYLYRVD